jgi:hypothetical protein
LKQKPSYEPFCDTPCIASKNNPLSFRARRLLINPIRRIWFVAICSPAHPPFSGLKNILPLHIVAVKKMGKKIKPERLWLALALALTAGFAARAQEGTVQIELGPDEIGINQPWTITITVQNGRLATYDNFPDIEGFKKRGASNQSQTNIINGQVTSSQSVIMNYTPTREGVFTIPGFKMKVNDRVYSVTGKKVRVGPAVQARSNDPFRSFFDRDPFGSFYGRSEPEFVDIKEEALLTLTTSKDEVYVGEGFTATLSFLVAENNRAPLQFYELGRQLGDILKKLRPANCWEENFNIENIEGESIEIRGKGYTQYKIYQAVYFPLNTEPVKFPSVGLEMIKYKIARNPTFFGQNRQEDFKTFYTVAKTVKVKSLPPHPLRETVAVGNYRLSEKITRTELLTGQSTGYEFAIYGEGNISGIEKPQLRQDGTFDFFEPNIRQTVSRTNGRVTGAKTFHYFLIPNEPGEYPLGNFFNWVFFNTATNRYDTLKASTVLRVQGESRKNQSIESSDPGSFYHRIGTADNRLRQAASPGWMPWAVYFLVLLTMGVTVYLMIRK